MTLLRSDPLLAIPVPLPLPAQLKPASRRVSPGTPARAASRSHLVEPPPEWERRMRPRGSSLNVSGSSTRSSNMPMPTVFAIVIAAIGIAAIGIAIPVIIAMRDKVIVALVGDGGRPEILW